MHGWLENLIFVFANSVIQLVLINCARESTFSIRSLSWRICVGDRRVIFSLLRLKVCFTCHLVHLRLPLPVVLFQDFASCTISWVCRNSHEMQCKFGLHRTCHFYRAVSFELRLTFCSMFRGFKTLRDFFS